MSSKVQEKFNLLEVVMRRLFLFVFSLSVIAGCAHAQDPEQSWDNLKTLRAGEKIQVVDQKLKSLDGTFVSFSDEAVSLEVKKNVVSVQRDNVLRVSSRERGHSRARNALKGFLLGGSIGLGIGVAMLASGALDIPTNEALLAGLVQAPVSFGLPGAAIGAAVSPGHPTIYRTERRNSPSASQDGTTLNGGKSK